MLSLELVLFALDSDNFEMQEGFWEVPTTTRTCKVVATCVVGEKEASAKGMMCGGAPQTQRVKRTGVLTATTRLRCGRQTSRTSLRITTKKGKMFPLLWCGSTHTRARAHTHTQRATLIFRRINVVFYFLLHAALCSCTWRFMRHTRRFKHPRTTLPTTTLCTQINPNARW